MSAAWMQDIMRVLDGKLIFPALAILSLIYFSWGIGIGIRFFDEGNFVYGATRILRGDVPFRDFFIAYLPGQFYLLALLFKIFGKSLMVGRIFSIITYLLIVGFAFCLAKKLAGQRLALLTFLLASMWFGAFGFLYVSTPAPSSMVLSLMSCLYLTEFIRNKRKRETLLAGIFTGMAALFRQDIGFYTFISVSVVLLAFGYTNLSGNESRKSKRLFEGFRTWLGYVIGVSVVTLPVLAFFVFAVPVRDLFYDLIQWPLVIQPEFYSLPYPAPLPNPLHLMRGEQNVLSYATASLMRVPFYFPLIVFAIVLLPIITTVIRKRRPISDETWIAILFLLLCITSLNLARGRSDLAHLYPATVPAMILFPSAFSNNINKSEKITHMRRVFSYLLLLLVTLSLGFYCLRSIPPPSIQLTSLNLNRARGIYLAPDDARNLEHAVKFVQEHVPEGRDIYVGNIRHDMFNTNEIMFYFLAERHCATKYYALAPGLTSTLEIQRKIINDLNQHDVNYIVIWIPRQMLSESNKSQESSGVTLLDEFIKTSYRPVRIFGTYIILRRYV